MSFKCLISLLIILLVSCELLAQSKDSRYSSKKAISDLTHSLTENKADSILAKDYIQLAETFVIKKQYAKAEENYKKAREIYVRLKDTQSIANMDRELAKTQEEQNKYSEAIENYESASRLSRNREMNIINKNDASRLKNASNPQAQSQYISSNVDLSNKIQNTSEQNFALKKMAKNQMDVNDTSAAIISLEKAKDLAYDNPIEKIEISQQIADVYKQTNQSEKAVEASKEAVKIAKEIKDPEVQVEQMQLLSSTYAKSKDTTAAINVLEEAYNIAVQGNNLRNANQVLQQLSEKYIKERNSQKALKLYADFSQRIDSLIAKDSTLIDAKFLEIQEKRITQLENERVLKDELISKQNTINYVLIAVIILILIFIVFIIKTLYSITRKNKKIALQSLRREMNPHFIFNSLNSVNQFIAENNEIEANKYLTSYSRLMRSTMENSNKDFVTLSVELEHLKEYLELEMLRFHDKFSYTISIDPNLDTEFLLVPNMLIQPQLENAIWHGLRYKEDKGLLQLQIEQIGEKIHISIEDNGIGIDNSLKMKTAYQKEHNSRGLKNTTERINLLNSLYNTDIKMTITDKEGEESGVIVLIECPLNIKK